jgi:RNA polymerase sigma-70 factor (ECF subfamily)
MKQAPLHAKVEELYHAYGKTLLLLGKKILGDRHRADDAFQQCFLRIYKNIHRIGPVSDPRTKSFIFIIMRNEAYRIYRQDAARRGRTESLDSVRRAAANEKDRAEERVPARAEAEYEPAACLSVLRDDDKDILILRYLHGYSDKEIEKILGISGNAVRKRVSRAKRRLAGVVLWDQGES